MISDGGIQDFNLALRCGLQCRFELIVMAIEMCYLKNVGVSSLEQTRNKKQEPLNEQERR